MAKRWHGMTVTIVFSRAHAQRDNGALHFPSVDHFGRTAKVHNFLYSIGWMFLLPS